MNLEETLHSRSKINEDFRLYDSSVWLIAFGLLYLTYSVLTSNKLFEQKVYECLGVFFAWIFTLFKVQIVRIKDVQTVVFLGLLRRISVNPGDITEYQEWVRGARVVHKDGSIILWPYVEKQGELKRLLGALNPRIAFRDLAAEGTRTNGRVAVIVAAVFLYFGWLIWSLFHDITAHFK